MVIIWIILPFSGVLFLIYFIRKKVRSAKLRMSLYSIVGLLIIVGFSVLVTGDVEKSLQYLQNLATNEQVAGTATSDEGKEDEERLESEQFETAIVERVVDGDTIVLDTGETVRYIGIDTPETVDPRREVQCFGKEASEKNKELVLGKKVRLEKDVSDTDRYGRILRYVYISDVLINEQLVREGFALSSSYPPDVKYQERFDMAEREARENNRGLWGEC